MAGTVLGTQRTIVDIQEGGPGRTNWKFLTESVGAGAFTVGLGNVTNTFEKNARTQNFDPLPPRREAPERVELPLTAKLRAANYLETLICEFAVRMRYACGTPSDPLEYERIDVLLQALVTNREYPDTTAALEPADADRMLNVNVSAGPTMHEIIRKVAGRAISLNAPTYSDVGLNDVWYCDAPTCACGNSSDGCNDLFAISDADSSPYATPLLWVSTDGGVTWSVRSIIGMTGAAVSGVCAGSKVIVAGTTFGGVAYATENGSYNDWVTNIADFTGGDPIALFAVDAATIYAACTGGAVYVSNDGGVSWTLSLAPSALSLVNLNAIAFVDASLGYAGGNSGSLLKYKDGAWSLLADPTGGANILSMAIPPGRPDELYIGTSLGTIWYTKDQGTTWTRMRWTGDGTGSIDRLAFAGALGTVLYFIQNNATSDGRVMRDLSGGAGGQDVEAVTTYVLPSNNGLYGLAFCGVNEGFAVGNTGANGALVVKVS